MSDRSIALARGHWGSSAPSHVQVSYSALSTSQTPVPSYIGPVSVLQVPSGGMVVTAGVRELVRGSAEFIQKVAAALPYSAEDDALLSGHMVEQTKCLKVTSLRRRIPDER